jgi:predicted P-loop ATPase/GTPase
MQSLMRLASGTNPKIAMFHASWAPGHNSTDYTRYSSIPPGSEEIYEVTQYQSAYEPYVIMSKRVTWYVQRDSILPRLDLDFQVRRTF